MQLSGNLLGSFDFGQGKLLPSSKTSQTLFSVLLHETFSFSRPLTVTCALKKANEVVFHQMTLDKVENGEYILQNTLEPPSASLIKISLSKRYYAELSMFRSCYDHYSQDFIYRGANNMLMHLTNETDPSMKTGEWYLFPWAYKITLTP